MTNSAGLQSKLYSICMKADKPVVAVFKQPVLTAVLNLQVITSASASCKLVPLPHSTRKGAPCRL